WGAFYKWHESALARLFHPETDLGRDRESMDDQRILRDLSELAARSAGAIAVRTAASAPPRRYEPASPAFASLKARTVQRRLTSMFRTSSFSALTAGPTEIAGPVAERDIDPPPAHETVRAEQAPDEPTIPLDEFPRGPRAGDLLHAIL